MGWNRVKDILLRSKGTKTVVFSLQEHQHTVLVKVEPENGFPKNTKYYATVVLDGKKLYAGAEDYTDVRIVVIDGSEYAYDIRVNKAERRAYFKLYPSPQVVDQPESPAGAAECVAQFDFPI